MSRFHQYTFNLLHKIEDNPIILKELRSRMRGWRAFAILTFYLLVVSSFIILIYATYVSNRTVYSPSAEEIGKVILNTMVVLQVFMIMFTTPAFTAGAIVGERERQTFDILRTTLVSEQALVNGKLASALAYVLLLIAAAIPIESIAFLVGGVEWAEIIISQLLLIVGALTYALVGLYFSTVTKSTVAATVSSFGTIMAFTFALPILVFFFMTFFSLNFSSWMDSAFTETILIYIGLFLASANLPASLITSELILLNEATLWAFKTSVGAYGASLTIWVLSPWYLFLLTNSLIIWRLYWAIVKRLRNP